MPEVSPAASTVSDRLVRISAASEFLSGTPDACSSSPFDGTDGENYALHYPVLWIAIIEHILYPFQSRTGSFSAASVWSLSVILE